LLKPFPVHFRNATSQTQRHFRCSQQSRSNCSKFELVLSLRQGLT